MLDPLPNNAETANLAKRLIWFESAELAMAQPVRLLAYAFAYATPKDMALIRKYYSDDELRLALDQAPPGVIDPRSWAYWHVMLGQYPPPPMPQRQLDSQRDC